MAWHARLFKGSVNTNNVVLGKEYFSTLLRDEIMQLTSQRAFLDNAPITMLVMKLLLT